MSEPNQTPRYDVKTEDNGGWTPLPSWHTYTTTIRDNETGEEYSATNYDADKSRDTAWEQVHQDK